MLKVDAGKPLPLCQLGNSGKCRVGEWVVAIGNPFGLGGTVTAGIVSARGRDIGDGPYDDFLQIDAPINRGNSGGPMFNQDGHVIGVNTAISRPPAAASASASRFRRTSSRPWSAELEKNGHVTRGYLGVEAQPVSPAMAAALNLPKQKPGQAGALIAQVEPDSPGLQGWAAARRGDYRGQWQRRRQST